MISLRSTCLFCVLLALCAVPAFCSIVTYPDEGSWSNAVSGASTITFDNLADLNSSAGTYTTGLLNDPTFLGTEVQGGDSEPYLALFDDGSVTALMWAAVGDETSSPMLQVTFPLPVSAFSLDLTTTFGAATYTVVVNGNTVFNDSSTSTQGLPGQTFFGVTSSDTPITSITFSLSPSDSNGATPLIDNFSYAGTLSQSDADDSPEVCTFLLIASGLIGMALIAKRVRGRAAMLT